MSANDQKMTDRLLFLTVQKELLDWSKDFIAKKFPIGESYECETLLSVIKFIHIDTTTDLRVGVSWRRNIRIKRTDGGRNLYTPDESNIYYFLEGLKFYTRLKFKIFFLDKDTGKIIISNDVFVDNQDFRYDILKHYLDPEFGDTNEADNNVFAAYSNLTTEKDWDTDALHHSFKKTYKDTFKKYVTLWKKEVENSFVEDNRGEDVFLNNVSLSNLCFGGHQFFTPHGLFTKNKLDPTGLAIRNSETRLRLYSVLEK